MIEVQLIGRIGNNLFQYAVCRSMAERLGCNFWVNPSAWKGFDLFNIPFGKRDGNTKHTYKEGDMGYDLRIESVVDFTTLIGFFQSEKYFDNDKVREWFKLCPAKDDATEKIIEQYPINEYCYLNIRGGDVKFISSQKLKLEYFDWAREKMLTFNPDLKFVVVTDDREYAKTYFPDLPIQCNTESIDFRLMNSAKYLIIANSSFAWWAAWLNQNNIVVAPQGWLNVNIDKWKPGPRDIVVERFNWI